jgi:hypothetical protein
MEEILALLVQFLIEVVFESLGYLPFEWLTTRKDREAPDSIGGACSAWLLVGGIIGGLSLLVLDHSLLHYGWLRIANLAVAPVSAGFVSEAFARRRQVTRPWIEPRHQFWFAFWFSFGIAVVRFAYASKF